MPTINPTASAACSIQTIANVQTQQVENITKNINLASTSLLQRANFNKSATWYNTAHAVQQAGLKLSALHPHIAALSHHQPWLNKLENISKNLADLADSDFALATDAGKAKLQAIHDAIRDLSNDIQEVNNQPQAITESNHYIEDCLLFCKILLSILVPPVGLVFIYQHLEQEEQEAQQAAIKQAPAKLMAFRQSIADIFDAINKERPGAEMAESAKRVNQEEKSTVFLFTATTAETAHKTFDDTYRAARFAAFVQQS